MTSGQPAALVTLIDVEKRYAGRTVLRVDRLEVGWHDWLVITGANGSGKSTLTRILAGVTVLSSGTVIRSSEYEAFRICYVPQAGGLHLHLTLADNLKMWQRLVGDDETYDPPWQSYVESLDLKRFLRVRCGDLSGGFQRLAAVACALSTRPDGLLVDEPLSGIDEAHSRDLIATFGAAHEHLKFLVVTSHSESDFSGANRFVDLSRGAPA